MGSDYKSVYLAALSEATELSNQIKLIERRRDDVEKRLMEMKKAILALAPLCNASPEETHPELFPEVEGLSKAVWKVLTQVVAGAWVSPVTVREQLSTVGYETKSKNILPSIHNVLKRFKNEGLAETKTIGRGRWYRSKPVVSNQK